MVPRLTPDHDFHACACAHQQGEEPADGNGGAKHAGDIWIQCGRHRQDAVGVGHRRLNQKGETRRPAFAHVAVLVKPQGLWKGAPVGVYTPQDPSATQNSRMVPIYPVPIPR